jgi:hypothetical protein
MKTINYILALFFLMSCSAKNERKQIKYSQINIIVDSAVHEFLDWPAVNDAHFCKTIYDPVQKQTISTFDSIRNGKAKISIFSLLTPDLMEVVYLKSDTSFSYPTQAYSNFTKVDPEKISDLSIVNSDSLYIAQKIVGCFGGHTEKIIVTKLDKKYQLLYTRNGDSMATTTKIISDTLFGKYFNKFIKSCKILFPKPVNGNIMLSNLSTTSINTYIRQNNIIYALPDFYTWEGYNTFKNDTGIIPKE